VAKLALLLTALLLLAGGCTPTVAGMGPATAQPALKDGHMRMADGAELPLRVWKPQGAPRAVFLALHGFNDYSKSFEEPAKYWAEHGVITYAYDQRGFGEAPDHGLWPGTQTLVEDARTAVRLVAARHPGLPLYLVGESMGSAVALTALGSDEPPRVAGAVLAAPAVRGWRVLPWYQKAALEFFAHTMPWATATGRGVRVRPSDNIEMLRGLGRDPLVIKETRFDSVYGLVNLMDAALAAAPHLRAPALILYGRTEDLIPRNGRELLLESLPRDDRWRLAVYPKGYHMLLRDLDAQRVLGDIVAWTENMDAPLPSGDERADRTLAPPPAEPAPTLPARVSGAQASN
jgi:alpha-beta hydrolase superfamily lysophospholipase